MTHVTCRLTAKNWDQLRNPTCLIMEYELPIPFTRPQIGEQSIVMRTTFLALTLTFVACCFTPDGGAEYCDERVCVFVKVTYLASLLTTWWDWLGETSLKCPILCHMGRKTTTQSISQIVCLLSICYSLFFTYIYSGDQLWWSIPSGSLPLYCCKFAITAFYCG